MTTLKCSRCTMLPTTWASRSYCLSFSGAFMALVYSPHAFGEIGIVGGDALRHAGAQQRQIVGRGRRGDRHRGWRVVIKTGLAADVAGFVRAFQPEAAAVPREERLAGDERARRAARGYE